jgi:hypothetical protein
LRARPVAQLRCSVIFSAIVLASGTVWRRSTWAVANWGLSDSRCFRP